MKKFLILWSGEFISAIGSGLTSFGLGVYIYQTTGKVSGMALITLMAFLPNILLTPFAGVFADRYDRRLLMIIGDGLSALGLLYIFLCMQSGNATLLQICIGVTISGVFSSLLEPSYKATITDLLTEEEYAKASGLVQIAYSSKYLISPVLAGFLLSVYDIKMLLLIDIGTFFLTVLSTMTVRKGLPAKLIDKKDSFFFAFKEGYKTIREKKGVFDLVLLTSLLTFFLGFIQTLSSPMILSFSTARTVGILETIVATGMLLSSILIGVLSIKKNYVKLLSISMCLTGIFMAMFGMSENLIFISVSGFLFFATLPFSNMSMDCLIRRNIENEKQGRAWGLMGIISQMGYVVAYSVSGVLADYIFTPMLVKGGLLEHSVGRIIGVGQGRGTGFLIMIAGILLVAVAVVVGRVKSIRELEVR